MTNPFLLGAAALAILSSPPAFAAAPSARPALSTMVDSIGSLHIVNSGTVSSYRLDEQLHAPTTEVPPGMHYSFTLAGPDMLHYIRHAEHTKYNDGSATALVSYSPKLFDAADWTLRAPDETDRGVATHADMATDGIIELPQFLKAASDSRKARWFFGLWKTWNFSVGRHGIDSTIAAVRMSEINQAMDGRDAEGLSNTTLFPVEGRPRSMDEVEGYLDRMYAEAKEAAGPSHTLPIGAHVRKVYVAPGTKDAFAVQWAEALDRERANAVGKGMRPKEAQLRYPVFSERMRGMIDDSPIDMAAVQRVRDFNAGIPLKPVAPPADLVGMVDALAVAAGAPKAVPPAPPAPAVPAPHRKLAAQLTALEHLNATDLSHRMVAAMSIVVAASGIGLALVAKSALIGVLVPTAAVFGLVYAWSAQNKRTRHEADLLAKYLGHPPASAQEATDARRRLREIAAAD